MPRLRFERSDVPDQTVHVLHACALGATAGAIAVPALGAHSLVVTPLSIGVVIEATAPVTVGVRRIAAGTPRLLRNGELASVGECRLTVIGDPPPEGTRELAAAMLAGLDPAATTGPGLLVVQGAGAGRRFSMGRRVVVGRGAGSDLVLADPLVSRTHLVLERGEPSGKGVRARDVGSKNGLVVNGRARRSRAIALRPGDELLLGETVLVLEAPPDGAPEAQDGGVVPEHRPARIGRLGRRGPAAPHARPETIATVFASAALLAAALLLARAAG